MRKRIPKILVTGGAGFIGSAFVRLLKNVPVVVDNLTYAGDLKRINSGIGKFKFYKADTCNKKQIESIFRKEKPDIVINFAAETHVDRSILGSAEFLKTNILGTQVLLEASRRYDVRRYIQISSDEVYGDIKKGKFSEAASLNPSSPYSASKAAGDLLVKSYIRTHKFPAIIIRPSNNYGPWQYPEKFIPVIIYKALKNERIPVYAKGLNVREWLHVDDCADAILRVAQKGQEGAIYNLGSGIEITNIEIAKLILNILGKSHNLIKFVKDRPGHDIRYSLDSSKIKRELGWKPSLSFSEGIEKTVSWYVSNLAWLETKVKVLRSYWNKVYK